MKPVVRCALLLSAILVAGAGVATGQMGSSPPPESAHSASGSFGHGRGTGRFLTTFDLNKDGKVTRDEFNKVLGQQFAQAAGSGQALTAEQFTNFRLKDLREHAGDMFRRADWNGDGKLSLEEYSTPERARFQYADRDGSGVLFCGGRGRSPADQGNNAQPRSQNGFHKGGRNGGRGRGSFCQDADLNHDGKITRAEFDKAIGQEFMAAAKGGALSSDAYYNIVAAHVRANAVKMFTRLDSNHDGKLTRDEFAASETKLFARLDRNNDGMVTPDEMLFGQRRYGAYGQGKPGRS